MADDLNEPVFQHFLTSLIPTALGLCDPSSRLSSAGRGLDTGCLELNDDHSSSGMGSRRVREFAERQYGLSHSRSGTPRDCARSLPTRASMPSARPGYTPGVRTETSDRGRCRSFQAWSWLSDQGASASRRSACAHRVGRSDRGDQSEPAAGTEAWKCLRDGWQAGKSGSRLVAPTASALIGSSRQRSVNGG